MARIVLPRLQLDPMSARAVSQRSARSSGIGPRVFADGEATPVDQASPAPRIHRPQHDVPPEYAGDPIHLTASVAGLQVGSAGASVNVKALRNPGPGAIEIFGIKFRLRSSQPITGALVACRLDLGDFQLTNGFIPVYAFGRAENPVLEQLTDGAFPPASCYVEYICRLSRPIYLPPGAVIRPQLQHKGLTTVQVDVHVSMFGRMLPGKAPPPEKLKLPFWASYVSKTFQLGLVDNDNSTENDLVNPFDEPLELERFVGRMSYFSPTAFLNTGAVMLEHESSNTVGAQALGDALGQVTCTIIGSDGYPVVKRPAPFRLIFDAETRSWPLTNTMPGGGYYLASMANSAWTQVDPFNGTAVFVQPCISMLGWREVA